MNLKRNFMKMAAVLPLAAVLVGCGRTTINANDYLDISVDGYDTVGTASYSIDYDKMIKDNMEAFGLDKNSEMEAIGVEMLMEEHLDGKLDKKSELKNGDKVTFKWNDSAADAIEQKYKVKFKLSDENIDVKDLDEPEKFDPFNFLTVSYEGFAPNGTIKLNADKLPVSGVSFSADPADSLSNGDTVKITFGGSDCEQECFDQGYIPETLEKEITVEGLASYIQTIDEVPEDAYKKMDEHAQDVLKAHVADKWVDKDSFKGMELIGNYILTPKDPSIYTSSQNILYFIYKVTAGDPSVEGDDKKDFDYYYYSSYDNIVLLEDGTCSFDLGSMKKPEGSAFFSTASGEAFIKGKLCYLGYEDLDSMFNNLITANIDAYKYESTVKE